MALLSNSTLDPTLQHALPRRLVALAEGRAAEPQPGAGSAPPFDAAAAAGAYKTPDGRRLTITNDGPQPRILLDDGPSYRLFRASPSVLYAPGLDAYLSYEAGVLRWATVFETFEARR